MVLGFFLATENVNNVISIFSNSFSRYRFSQSTVDDDFLCNTFEKNIRTRLQNMMREVIPNKKF